MYNKPKVSVIIPIYGVETYLRECLDSAINQTLREIEIILINDGSKDKCPEIIDEYAAKDSRIISVHKENAGYGAACNTGLAIAQGEYVAIFEPDDYVALDMYEKMYNQAVKTNVDIVRCEFSILEGTSCTPSYCWDVPQKEIFSIEEAPSFLLYKPSVWAALYKRDFLVSNDIKLVEYKGAGFVDTNFKYETFFAAESISYLKDALYVYRVNAGSSVKKQGLVDLEATRWEEIDKALLRYPERVEKLKDYVTANKVHTFKWALYCRVHRKHWNKLFAVWQKSFSEMNTDEVLNNKILNREDKKLFRYVKGGRFLRIKWLLFKKGFFSRKKES